MTTTCRFCLAPIEVPLPTDPRMERFMRVLATKACCNRCAEYQRAQRDRAERLGKLGLNYKYAKEDEKGAIQELAKRLIDKIVSTAEEHHLVHGLGKDSADWLETFRQTPDSAEWQAKLFVRGVADIAKQAKQ